MKKASLLVLLVALLCFPVAAWAVDLSFQVNQTTTDVYFNQDGTASIEYLIVFSNDLSGDPIDYVDIGLPNGNYDRNSITAEVNGQPITDIEDSDYLPEGVEGVALGLGANAIQPGETGEVRVSIPVVRDMFFVDPGEDQYASVEFSPNWFGSEFVNGTTDLAVTFHLPPGVQPDEPRWHSAPSGFPEEPETGLDDQGRPTYTWRNPAARSDRKYVFGASFPTQYVDAATVQNPSFSQQTGISQDAIFGILFCGGSIGFIALMVLIGIKSSNKRRLQYLPPKISIEGHGIKRGLTAIEAAILMEEPMDKILTMILFAVIKKNLARVVTRDPLELEIIPQATTPDLHAYETGFLEAFSKADKLQRRKALQEMMTEIVKSVSAKMKGFSRRETVAYYRDIMKRAWAQVEAADTPEVKSQKYDEVMEWTMLDRDYEDRTRDVFRGGPVFIPGWWGRWDPGYGGGSTAPRPSTSSGGSGSSGGGGISLPTLPGSDFAGSVVTGTQQFAGSVIGNITDFTGAITNRTNPIPVAQSSGRSGGGRSGGCACACACAGCACACAGGGR